MLKCEKCIHKKICIDGANYKNAEACRNFVNKNDFMPVKHGRWIYGEYDIPHCSECGSEVMPIIYRCSAPTAVQKWTKVMKMIEFRLISEDNISITYSKSDFYNKLTFFFNKNLKNVDIEYQRFVPKEENVFIPQREENHSCKYGHWQVETPCLSMEDINFLHSKCKALWGLKKIPNREILFRGKHKDNGEWVEGYLVKYQPSASENKFIVGIVPTYASALYLIDVIPETVERFTGLTDKNGVKIFEGDIVKDDWGKLYRVYFTTKGCSFMVECYSAHNEYEIGDYRIGEAWCDTIRVIGNIHDNPEMLT